MKCVVIAIIFLFCLNYPINSLDLGNSVKLKADHITYSENNTIIKASKNVELFVDNVSIKTDQLSLNTKTNTAWGSSRVEVNRHGSPVYAKGFDFNFSDKIVNLSSPTLTIQPPDSSDFLFIRAGKIEHKSDHQSGYNGFLTSCSLPKPHYYAWAHHFDYYPSKNITATNLILYQPLWFVPFAVWSPYYRYELGERSIIWNFPAIGRKESAGWGWFMQNTIDYDYVNGKESSVLVDLFQFKGIGLGINHQYDVNWSKGSAYYYELIESDTKKKNIKIDWNNTLFLNDTFSVVSRIRHSDSIRINSLGNINEDEHYLGFHYDNLGDKYDLTLNDLDDKGSNFRRLNINFDRKFNNEHPLSIKFNQSDISKKTRFVDTTLIHQTRFQNDAKLNTQFNFRQKANLTNNDHPDDRLQINTSYTQQFSNGLNLNIVFDHLLDLDGDSVTADSQSNGNDFLFKQPEVNLAYSYNTMFNTTLTGMTTIARYQEVQYDTTITTQNIFPSEADFDLMPNVFISRHQLAKSIQKLPLNGHLNLNFSYDQYNFAVPEKNKSLFEGDAIYKLSFSPNYSFSFMNFVQSNTRYSRSFTPTEGNSPFKRHFNLARQNVNELNQSLTFYAISPSNYAWNHALGYDYERERWNPYTTSILISPSSKIALSAQTGIDLNIYDEFKASTGNMNDFSIFRPLVWGLNYAPSPGNQLYYQLSQDLNKGGLSSSAINLKNRFGSDKDYFWEFNSQFTYDTGGELKGLSFDKYILQSISLVKYEHCRKFTFSYNTQTEEIRIMFTVLAFPKDTIGFIRSNEVWKIKGILDDTNQERF